MVVCLFINEIRSPISARHIIDTYINTYIHTYSYLHTHTYIHTRTHINTHTYTRINTHTYIHQCYVFNLWYAIYIHSE